MRAGFNGLRTDIREHAKLAAATTLGVGALFAVTFGSSADGPAHPVRHPEVEQFGAPTFGDYTHAAEPGPFLQRGAKVIVDCVAKGPIAAAPSAEGEWYHLVAPKTYAGEYVAANTFENGDTSGPLSSQPAVDPRVPHCPPAEK